MKYLNQMIIGQSLLSPAFSRAIDCARQARSPVNEALDQHRRLGTCREAEETARTALQSATEMADLVLDQARAVLAMG